MSLLTSQYPNVHNVNITDARLAEHKQVLAEQFQRNGWLTHGIYHNPYLGGMFGFRKGFEDYVNPGGVHGNQCADSAITWLQTRPQDRPFFFFLHFNDPHMPYGAPQPFYSMMDPEYQGDVAGEREDVLRYLRAPIPPRDLLHIHRLYLGEVRYLDQELARVFRMLKDLDLYDDMLIIVTADHGEEFKEHGKLEHNQMLYEEMIRVPLAIKLPKKYADQYPPRLFDGQVKNIDIMPTILELVGLLVPESAQGHSLVPLFAGTAQPDFNDMVFSESANTHRVSIRSAKWKYIYDRVKNTAELYDLQSDPAERNNLISHEPQIASEFNDLVMEYMVQAQGGWHLRVRPKFQIRAVLKTSGAFKDVEEYSLESADEVTLSDDKRTLSVRFHTDAAKDKLDGVDFALEPLDAALTMEVQSADGADPCALVGSIFIGPRYRSPEDLHVVLQGTDMLIDPTLPLDDVMIVNKGKRSGRAGMYIWKHPEQTAAEVLRANIDEETRANLESLGYFR